MNIYPKNQPANHCTAQPINLPGRKTISTFHSNYPRGTRTLAAVIGDEIHSQ